VAIKASRLRQQRINSATAERDDADAKASKDKQVVTVMVAIGRAASLLATESF